MIRLFVVMALLLLALPARAQDGDPGLFNRLADELQTTAPPATSAKARPDLLFPDLPDGYIPDDATRTAMDQSVRAYYEYRRDQFEHRLNVFKWQYNSSRTIFVVVVLIVVVGLYFSWMQFHDALKRGKDLPATEFDASAKSFKVSSPILGVIILLLSLVFFYLYLVHVYPITEVGG